jgi:hypothetical protein
MTKFFSYSLHFTLGAALTIAPFHKDFSASFPGGAPISTVLGLVAIFQSCAKLAEPDGRY